MKRNITANIIKYIFLFLFSLVFIVPFLYAIYTSLLNKADIDKIVPLTRLTLENYIYILTKNNLLLWYRNSIIVTVGIVIGNIFVNSLAGYALAKLRFPGKTVIFFIVIGTMMIPYQICLIPVYIMIVKLGWINTFQSMIVPFLCNGFLAFLMRQFYLTIPDEILEAACIDGASHITTFYRIIFPLSKTALATMIIFSFTGTWNSFIWPVTLVNNPKYYVLTVGLNTLKNEHFEWMNITMTGVVLVTLPVAVIFMIFQKYFTRGIMSMGIKG